MLLESNAIYAEIYRLQLMDESVVEAFGSEEAAALVATGNYAHAFGDDKIRVALIGAGGRGSGAAVNVTSSAPGVPSFRVACTARSLPGQARSSGSH